MPKVITSTDEATVWQESHRCVICSGLPVTVKTEMVEEHRQLKPAYKHMAVLPGPYEAYMTEHVGGEYLSEVECENGHLFRCHYHRFREET